MRVSERLDRGVCGSGDGRVSSKHGRGGHGAESGPENEDEAGSVGVEHRGGCLKNAREREGYWNIKIEIMRCRVKEEGKIICFPVRDGNRLTFFGSQRSFLKRDAKMCNSEVRLYQFT